MRLFRHNWIAVLLMALFVNVQIASAQREKPAADTGKPNVVILATGGTIAGAAASGTQAGYTSGAVNIETMIGAVPGITDLADIKGEQVANVGSQDMTFDILLKLAKRINALAKSPEVDGI